MTALNGVLFMTYFVICFNYYIFCNMACFYRVIICSYENKHVSLQLIHYRMDISS